MKQKYSSYRSGLEIGDMVYFKRSFRQYFSNGVKHNALVLDREFLYENETRYGVRRFFKYKFLDIHKNKVFDIETKYIRVLKTFKTNKEIN